VVCALLALPGRAQPVSLKEAAPGRAEGRESLTFLRVGKPMVSRRGNGSQAEILDLPAPPGYDNPAFLKPPEAAARQEPASGEEARILRPGLLSGPLVPSC